MSRIQISTLSPVHVGSGRFLMAKSEYVFGQENLGIIDDKKVLELLGEDRIQDWVTSIDKGLSLVSFLKTCGINPSLQKISKRTLRIHCEKTRAATMPNLKEQIHNGMGLPYIPGSSLKGAFRSAILNLIIRGNRSAIQSSKLISDRGPTAKFIERELFGGDPNHDVFRFLRVGDAYFQENATLAAILENLNLKGNPDDPEPRLDPSKNQLVEMIGKSENSGLDIDLNTKGMQIVKKSGYISEFPTYFSDLNLLFKSVNNNTITLLNEELDFWSDYHGEVVEKYLSRIESLRDKATHLNEGECILRLALGSGWRFISGNWLADSDLVDDDTFDAIVYAARYNNSKYSQFPFPKSRRITSNMELPGFVSLKRVSD